jgi:hypothetical protein
MSDFDWKQLFNEFYILLGFYAALGGLYVVLYNFETGLLASFLPGDSSFFLLIVQSKRVIGI